MKYAVSKRVKKAKKKKKVGENVIYVRVHLSVREMLFLIECHGFTLRKKKRRRRGQNTVTAKRQK